MKLNLRYFLVAAPALAVGLIIGAVVSFEAYKKAFGSPEQNYANLTTNLAFLLGPTKAAEATAQPEDVVKKTYVLANFYLVSAGMLYASLDPLSLDPLVRAARLLDRHPLAANDSAGNTQAMMAREARRCIIAGGAAKTVQECVSHYVTDLLDNTCPGKNVPKPCALPMVELQPNLAGRSTNSQASR